MTKRDGEDNAKRVGASFGVDFRGARFGRWLLTLGLLAAVLPGCSDLLEVQNDPDVVGGGGVEGEGAFEARFNGAQADFAAGFDEQVAWGALFADELIWGGTAQGRNDVHLRNVDASNVFVGDELWRPLQVAAASTASMTRDIRDGDFPTRVPEGTDSEAFARMAALTGYTRVILADLFCTLAFDGTGPELTELETYALAEGFFGEALAASSASAETRNLALVGRARARLMLGDLEGAVADAEQVTEGFEFDVEFSSNSAREENRVFEATFDTERWSVEEVFRDVTIDDTDIPDPRVEVEGTGTFTFGGTVPLFQPLKYSSRGADIRMASWFETQYILAEVRGGQEAVDILNDVRARQGIEQEFQPGSGATEAEILAKILDERGRTLFIEGQRMADLRRFRERHGIDRFPGGMGFGDQVCMPLPEIERDNNPDI